jgi:peptide/nickel transport system ATP-binding protein
VTRPLLEVHDLHVEFPGSPVPLRALDGVSLHIHAGEILGIVGESGAGKSLTGAAITGLIEPPGRITGGRIVFDGQRIDGMSDDALRRLRGRRIGMIFQDPLTALDPLFTIGAQLVETIRTHLPMSREDATARAVSLLAQTGIPSPQERLRQYPHQFSGGMRQRVVIALALAAGPRLVIADEPTTALDVSVQAQVIDLLKRLCREQGTALMLVTHDMGVIAEACDRVAVMYCGRIVEVGAVRQILHSPAHPYTAGLMRSIPPLDRDVERLEQIEGAMPRLDAIPSGCPFHPRCPQVLDRCSIARPELLSAKDREVACWLHASDDAR